MNGTAEFNIPTGHREGWKMCMAVDAEAQANDIKATTSADSMTMTVRANFADAASVIGIITTLGYAQ